MKRKGSDICKEWLAAWVRAHESGLTLDDGRGPYSKDGMRPSHWIRRGKGVVKGEQVRAFELYIGMWNLPATYAVLSLARDGTVERLEWMELEDLCRLGIRVDTGVGGQFYWDARNGRMETT